MMNLQKTERSGITILEVIIAMGIAIFGLLSVMAIVPFAARRAQSGLEIEEGAQLAQRALGDFHAYDMGDPENWVAWSPLPVPAPYNLAFGWNRYVEMPSFFHPLTAPNPPSGNPNERWFFDEAILIDPQFCSVNPQVTQFPYCYESPVGQPAAFVDDETGLTALYRDGLFSPPKPPGFTAFDAVAPGVRRVSLRSGVSTDAVSLAMNFAMAREVFETGDDLSVRELEPQEQQVLPDFDFKRVQYYEGVDPTNNLPVEMKELALGQTSWVAMLVPENPQRTVWKLFIIVIRDRDPSFGMDLVNERVARIRGAGGDIGSPIGPECGFQSAVLTSSGNAVARHGGLVRMESWGTSNLAQGGTQPVPGTPVWTTMERDLAIAPNQWVLLAQWGPQKQRRYQWYRVLSASPNTELGPVDNVPFNNGGFGGIQPPSRTVSLIGPDWDARRDTLVYMMNNVVSVYERTIQVPLNRFPQPQIHPWDIP